MQDKKLITLVEQYVRDRNDLYVNIHAMTDALQKEDKNYSTIPKAEFRKSLQKVLESLRRKQNTSNGPRNESLSLLSSSSLHKANEIEQRKRPFESEFTVDCKRMRPNVCQMPTSMLNKSPSGIATNFDSLSERLRSNYAKRTSQNISRASAADNHEALIPLSPVSAPCGLFVIDRNGDFDIDVCCNAQNNDLEPSVPAADAERPPQATGPCRTSYASVADRSLDSDGSDHVKKKTGRVSSSRKLKRKTNLEEGDSGTIEKARSFKVSKSEVRFYDLGASDTLLSEEDIEKIVTAKHPKGIIITGAKGTGKSTLAVAIVGELQLPYITVTGVQLTNGRNGGREDFESLVDIATLNAPCAVIVENVLHRYSNESSRMDDLMLARLQALFHEVNKEKALIWIIATASKLSSVEEDLLGKGGFEVRINLSLPKENARLEILNTLLRKSGANLSSDVNLQQIARNTPAYAPGDLVELIETGLRKAQLRMHKEQNLTKSENDRTTEDCWWAKYQNLPSEDEVAVTAADFEAAVKSIIPAARNQGHFIESTKVTWDDIGGLEHVRKQLETSFLRPIKYPLLCSHLGLTSRPVGVLLYGPPGCGKTLVAKALANEGSLSFMAINGPELFTKYVGESERNVREIFEKAEKSAPCVIYFDEIDSLCQRRESTEGGAKANVVNQILTELDGVESREQVYVVGSTNRIDCIDEALLRPGRFSKITEIGLPDGHQRFEILKALTKRAPQLADDVNLEELAMDKRCENFSGADLSGLVCAAAELCLEALSTEMDSLETRMKQGERIPVPVGKLHFEMALEQLYAERISRHKRRLFTFRMRIATWRRPEPNFRRCRPLAGDLFLVRCAPVYKRLQVLKIHEEKDLQRVMMQSSEEAELKCLCEQLDETLNDFFGTLTELLNTRRDLENFIKEGFFLMARARYSMGAKSVTSMQYNPDDLQKAFSYVTVRSSPDGNISFLPDISSAKAQSRSMGRLGSCSSGFEPLNKSDSECVELDQIDATFGQEQNADIQSGLRRRNLPKEDHLVKSGASEAESSGEDSTTSASLEHLVSGMENISCETEGLEKQDMSSESSTSSESCRESGKDPLLWFGVLVPQPLRQSQAAFRRAVELSCRVATLQQRLAQCQVSYKEMMGKKSRLVRALCKISTKADPEDKQETDNCENTRENTLPEYDDVKEAAS